MDNEDDKKPDKETKVEIREIYQSVESAPVIYVDGAHGITVGPAGAKINFYQDVQELNFEKGQDPRFVRRICLRLVLAPGTLVSIYDWLAPTVDNVRGRLAAKQEREGKNE